MKDPLTNITQKGCVCRGRGGGGARALRQPIRPRLEKDFLCFTPPMAWVMLSKPEDPRVDDLVRA